MIPTAVPDSIAASAATAMPSTDLLYYALLAFVAALVAAIWMFADSRNSESDSAWVSFAATLGPLVSVAGAVTAAAQLLGMPLLDNDELVRNLLWLSIGGGVATLVAALVYASQRRRRGSTDEPIYVDDFGHTDVIDGDVFAGDDGAMTPAPTAMQRGGMGIMIGGGSPNETVLLRPDGAVEGVIAWLTYLTDPHRGTELPLGRDARIGRDPQVEIVIDDPEVSAWHARLQYSDRDGFMLRDVGSTNGTFVNGEQVDVHTLSDHDTIRVGNTELEFFWVRQQSEVPGDLAYRATLLLQTGEKRGDTMSLNQDKILVGSSKRCDICLSDEGVAGVHAVISRDGNGYVISTIGEAMARVNGKSADEQLLSDRDEITLGKARLLFRDGIDR